MSASLGVLMVSDVYAPRINGVSTSIETFRAILPTHGVRVAAVVPRYAYKSDTADILLVPAWPLPRDPEDRLTHYRLRQTVLNTRASLTLFPFRPPLPRTTPACTQPRCWPSPSLPAITPSSRNTCTTTSPSCP